MTHPSPGPEPAGAVLPNDDTDRETVAALGGPVQQAYIAALARRGAAHQGAVRQLLDNKLARARAACNAQGSVDPLAVSALPGLLGQLVQYIDAQADAPLATPAAAASTAQPERPRRDLKALAGSRSTWARLRIERQLGLSLKQVPQNSGPLNSQLLMLRSLQLMQDLSPAYLEHFMAHVEALLWLDQAATASAAAPPRPKARPATRR